MKYIKLFEAFINENLKKVDAVFESVSLSDLVDTKFSIEIGSGITKGTWSEKDLIEEIKEAIKHNLFDQDFYYNWTDNGGQYKKAFEKDTLEPLLKNIDKTLNDMFTFKGNKLTFNIKFDKAESWIDNWFKTNKSISNSLRKDYYDYREKYADVKLK